MKSCKYVSTGRYVFFTKELLEDEGIKKTGEHGQYGRWEPFEFKSKLYRPIEMSLSGWECKEYEPEVKP
jgi:hypothetical protein